MLNRLPLPADFVQQTSVSGKATNDPVGSVVILNEQSLSCIGGGLITRVPSDLCLIAHTIQHVLVACSGEYLILVREITQPGCPVFPELQPITEAVRYAFRSPIIDPELRVIPLTEQVVELEKIDNPVPAVKKQLVVAF